MPYKGRRNLGSLNIGEKNHNKAKKLPQVHIYSFMYSFNDTIIIGNKDQVFELFASKSALKSNQRVQLFLNYLEIVGGPFDLNDTKLKHICNGSSLASNVVKGMP